MEIDRLFKNDIPDFRKFKQLWESRSLDYDRVVYNFCITANDEHLKIFKEFIEIYIARNLDINRLFNINFGKYSKNPLTVTLLMANSFNDDLLDIDVCKLLLSNGADPNIKNNKNMRALDYAVKTFNYGLVTVLSQHVNEKDYLKHAIRSSSMKALLENLNNLTTKDFDYAFKRFPELKNIIQQKRNNKDKIKALQQNDKLGVLSGIHPEFKDYLYQKLNETSNDLLYIRDQIYTPIELLNHLRFNSSHLQHIKIKDYTDKEKSIIKDFIMHMNEEEFENNTRDFYLKLLD